MKKPKLSIVVKAIALLLVVLLPAVAMAQNPAPPAQNSSRSKLKWIAVGSVIGGAALAVVGVMSKSDATNSRTTAGSTCTTSQTGTVASVACVSTTGPVVAIAGGGAGPATGPTLTNPGTGPLTSPMLGAPPSIISLSTGHRRGINWKLVVPSIGAASAGAFALYRDQARKKSAELSVRPDGTAEFAFRW